MSIPKIIWSYWHSLEIPETVKLCIESWGSKNPDYEIRFLNKDTYKKYVSIDIYSLTPNISHQRATDYLRLYLIKYYGGVWMDASICCTSSLNTILTGEKCVLYSYKNTFYKCIDPRIESWFIAAVPDHVLINKWYDEFKKVFTFYTIIDYLINIGFNFNFFENRIIDPYYLTMYVCIQHILNKEPHLWDVFKCIRAEDTALKNIVLHYNIYINTDKSLSYLLDNKKIGYPIVKLTGDLRDKLESNKVIRDIIFYNLKNA